jgi:membrane-associated phospholipid phosphatase
MGSRLAVAGAVLLASSFGAPALAETAPSEDAPAEELRWKDEWRRFGVADLVATAFFCGVTVATLLVPTDPDRWRSRNALDTSVRDVLRLETQEGRDRARDASDVLFFASVNLLLVDSFVVAWFAHDARDVGLQLALVDLETMSLAAAVHGTTTALASRERPYADPLCNGDAETELDDCRGRKRYRSFFSGHASFTFGVAAATCVHHVHLPLYGGGFADAVPCVLGLGSATATAFLRVASDQHWTTDVIAGAAIGGAVGALTPLALFYGFGSGAAEADRAARAPSLGLVPTATGAMLVGRF